MKILYRFKVYGGGSSLALYAAHGLYDNGRFSCISDYTTLIIYPLKISNTILILVCQDLSLNKQTNKI